MTGRLVVRRAGRGHLIAGLATMVLRDSADGLILGGFLFLLVACALSLCYVIAALLRQGILGGTLAFATGLETIAGKVDFSMLWLLSVSAGFL